MSKAREKCSQIMMEQVECHADTGREVDLFPYVKRCALDIICGVFTHYFSQHEKTVAEDENINHDFLSSKNISRHCHGHSSELPTRKKFGICECSRETVRYAFHLREVSIALRLYMNNPIQISLDVV